MNNPYWNPEKPSDRETITITDTVNWVDADDQDGLRPGDVIIRLYADGKEVDRQAVTASESGIWRFRFTGLDKYRSTSESTSAGTGRGAQNSTAAVFETAVDGWNSNAAVRGASADEGNQIMASAADREIVYTISQDAVKG